ncbi:DUF6489 family protein [Pyruvatibacter sp.]|uniref:DUF6489 family protein n=1 Tax=unclassified Pyruvatibacter TaxID=2618840 RepID=UPI00296852FD|nr:DUF6489 family protein [Alphaproteobacteria bacterium]
MKINIDIEMTPEEARKVIGLPDLAPMQEELVAQISDQIKRNVAYVDPELLVKLALPVGVEGIDKLQKLFWGVAKSAVGGGGAPMDDEVESDSPAPKKTPKTRRKRS